MSAIDSETRRLRAALAGLAEVKGDGAECPDSSTIWDSAAERLAPKANNAVILHLGECTACAVAWELARDLAPVEEPESVEAGRPWLNWLPLAAAAAVVIVATGLWLLGPTNLDAPPVLRDLAGDWLASEVPETLARDAFVLRWQAGPEGTLYDVNVTTESLDPLVWRHGLERPELTLDPGVLEPLSPGSAVLWRVTAHLPDGQRVSSKTFRTIVE